MASKIYHGNPGSYKSSSAVWFDLLPALRKGRCVVTNVEGILDLESIEKVLGEKFPDSAQLWRFSTLNDTGHNIVARWFHWLPVGALLLIDEVQNVYSDKDRNELKEHNVSLDSEVATNLVMGAVDSLPIELRDYSMSCLDGIADDGYTDDLSLSERDSNGHIRYPRNIKDALMRHRKFNWDILLCTPDITKVHSLIRSVAETAVQHKSLDSFPLPYFQRRPRTFEHNAQEKGLTAKQGDIIKRRKIPLDVFKLYKSTQTGKNNKSGAAASPIESNGFKFAVGVLLSILAFWIYFISGFFADDESATVPKVRPLVEESVTRVVEVHQAGDVAFDTGDSGSFNTEISYPEPLVDYTFYSTGYMSQNAYTRVGNTVRYEQDSSFDIVFIDVYQDDKFMFSTDNTELVSMGYQFRTLSECVYRVTYASVSRVVVCYDKDEEQDPDESEESTLFASSPTSLL